MIYVRAPTRIGKQYQTTVPEAPNGPSSKLDRLLENRISNKIFIADPDIPSRGDDETVELMSAVVHMTEQQSKFELLALYIFSYSFCSE
jgi:hypothetical protein